MRACPTWSWAAGDESRLKTFLPRDRQFLVTRGVPCFKRANAVLGLDALTESMVEGDGDGEDWVQTGERGGGGSGPVVEIGGEDSDGRIDAACTADEIPDIDALGLDDEAAVRYPGTSHCQRGVSFCSLCAVQTLQCTTVPFLSHNCCCWLQARG